jgi:RNA polymerase sigma factor (sigma-70 family)
MTRPETDAAILTASIADPTRFSVLYERHLEPIAGYLARRVGPELAEDLCAEVFVRAFRARDRYRPDHDSALPWLFGIAGNLVSDNRRAERRRLALLARLARDTPAAAADDDGRRGRLDAELARQLRRLPAGDRDALLITAWGELSYEEAAVALGVPIGTVRSRIFRARRRLAAAIGASPPAADTRPPHPATGGGRHA